MKSNSFKLFLGIFIGIGLTIIFNMMIKTKKLRLEALPAPFYKILFENNDVRIIDHKLNPGEIEPMHNHPKMYAYFIDEADITIIDSLGNRTLKSFKKGQNFLAQAQDHSIENTGEKPLHTLLVEIK